MYPSNGIGFSSIFSSRQPGASDIVSFASVSMPALTSVSYTLSRDRQLRVWKNSCIGTIRVPSSYDSAHADSSKAGPLLPPSQGNYVRVYNPKAREDGDEADPDTGRRVLVFVPTPAEGTGGFFVFYQLSAETDDLILRSKSRSLSKEWVLGCSSRSAGWDLRDFALVEETLYVLWDAHGRSVVEFTALDEECEGESEEGSDPWRSADQPLTEDDCDPAQFDELLLGKESFADVFLGTVLRPEVFSRITLETAIYDYREAILTSDTWSAPGVKLPPALMASYPTLEDRIAGVVASTVECGVDLQTGEQLWDAYWGALKRDWGGFVARCREIERSARRPIALGVFGSADTKRVLVLEGERLGTVVQEDSPLQALREIHHKVFNDNTTALFDFAIAFRDNLNSKTRVELEQTFIDQGKSLLAFSFSEVGADIAQNLIVGYDEGIDPALHTWIERLDAFGDCEAVIDDAIEVIRDLEALVKQDEAMMEEEEDVFRSNTTNSSATLALPSQDKWEDAYWPKALAASYVTASVTARYDLCLALLITVAFASVTLPDKLVLEPSALDRVFDAFKTTAILRAICRTSSTSATRKTKETVDDGAAAAELEQDELLTKLKGMRVGSVGAHTIPPKAVASKTGSAESLVYLLLSQPTHTRRPSFNVLESAHTFLHANELLKLSRQQEGLGMEVAEVRLLEHLRQLGFLYTVREISPWNNPAMPSGHWNYGL